MFNRFSERVLGGERDVEIDFLGNIFSHVIVLASGHVGIIGKKTSAITIYNPVIPN